MKFPKLPRAGVRDTSQDALKVGQLRKIVSTQIREWDILVQPVRIFIAFFWSRHTSAGAGYYWYVTCSTI